MSEATAAQYVAMGSSFAAGPGIPPRAAESPRAAGRSASNYAHLVAARLGLQLADATYSGATIAQITGLEPGSDHPAQLAEVRETTRLVTITGGGNDVGYLPRLTLGSLPWFLKSASARERLASLGDPAENDRAFALLRESLSVLVQSIRRRGEAVIALTDYLTILPPAEAGLELAPLDADIAAWGRRIAERLTRTVSEIADAEGAIFVPLAALSAEHHAWSPQPWTMRFHWSLRGRAPYHPNARGMAAAADAVVAAVQGRLPSNVTSKGAPWPTPSTPPQAPPRHPSPPTSR